MEISGDWLSWQLSDSAFPSGGFAHSGGLEATWQWKELRNGQELFEFIEAALIQAGHQQLPLVIAAHRDSGRVGELDRFCEAMLSNHVANRASRRQGQALLASARATFGSMELEEIADSVRQDDLVGHFPPIFGAVTAALRISLEQVTRMFLFVTLRGLVSSAIRLNVVGPLQGQAIGYRLHPFAEYVANRCDKYSLEDVSMTAPIIDVLQATQDRLYSRLFQS